MSEGYRDASAAAIVCPVLMELSGYGDLTTAKKCLKAAENS
jgi:hypothetical protein